MDWTWLLSSNGPGFDALDRPPLLKNGANSRQTSHGHGNVPGIGEGGIVSLLHPGEQTGRHLLLQRRGTNVENDGGIHTRSVLGDFGDETVVKDILCHRHEQGASKGLHEHDQGCAGRNVLERKDGLHGDQGLLHAKAHAESVDDLIPNPLLGPGVGGKGGEKTCADGGEDDAHIIERSIVSNDGRTHTGQNVGDDQGQNHGKTHDSGLESRGALDGLEPDRNPVNQEEECTAESEGEPGSSGDTALGDDVERDGGEFLHIVLNNDKDDG